MIFAVRNLLQIAIIPNHVHLNAEDYYGIVMWMKEEKEEEYSILKIAEDAIKNLLLIGRGKYFAPIIACESIGTNFMPI